MKKRQEKDQAAGKMQAAISEKLMGVFDLVLQERTAHYAKPSTKKPTKDSVDHIISGYVKQNTAMSAAFNMIPGPAGMVAAVPEIVGVIRNQLAMIYDVGMAYGQERFITRDLLLGIFVENSAKAGTQLVLVHGGKLVLKRTSLRVFQKVVAILGGKLTQQVLKRSLAKWVPVVGAGAIAAWTNHSTKKLGEKAKEMLALEIEVDSEQEIEEILDISPEIEVESINTEELMGLIEDGASPEMVAKRAERIGFNGDIEELFNKVNENGAEELMELIEDGASPEMIAKRAERIGFNGDIEELFGQISNSQ